MNTLTRALVVLTGAGMVLLTACGKQSPAAATAVSRAVPVRTTMAVQRAIAEEVFVTGTLKPQAQVQVVSEIAARMLHLNTDEGRAVGKGEVIAVLDDTDARLAHERASAAVAVAQANREHAVAERDRANNLLKTGGITDKDHLAAEVNLQVAEAALRQAKAEAAIAAQQVARCQIHAPFSGRIAKRHVDVGTMLAPGTPVVTLVDNSVIEFRGSVPSADITKVRLGAPVAVSVDAMPGVVLRGQITRVLPVVDERSRSFEVVARVADSTQIISGLFARARIKVRDIPDALVVPPAAVVHNGSGPDIAYVFVVENGKAELRQVSIGFEGVDSVQVRQGLTPGTVIVVDPPTTLAAGAPVQIITADAETRER